MVKSQLKCRDNASGYKTMELSACSSIGFTAKWESRTPVVTCGILIYSKSTTC